MAILGAVQVPHPPLILPEVGHGEEKRIQSTIDAFEMAAKFIANLQPDTVIVSSPHSILSNRLTSKSCAICLTNNVKLS